MKTIIINHTKQTIKKLSLISLANATMLSALISMPSIAEDRYVSDVIYVPLRSDKANQASIVKNGLASGTKLTFIREEEDASKNKWSEVITQDQVQGWIRSQNLTKEPTCAVSLNALSSGSSDVLELKKQNLSFKTELDSLKITYEKLLNDTEEMRNAVTSDINMEQENQNMHREFQLLQTERDVLKAENDQLRSTDRHAQQLVGGGLLLAGVALSFLLQLFGRRKRQSDWN